MRRFLAIMALAGCGHAREPEQLPPIEHVEVMREEAEERAVGMSSPPGWIVSQWVVDGRITHTGDSLLWSGMALGVLSCERGDVVERALLAMLSETRGKVYRHPSQKARKPSLDGHLGLYWGIARRVTRCPESAPLWAAAMKSHVPVNVPEAFLVVRDGLTHLLGLRAAPSVVRRDALGSLVAGWAGVVTATKSAAYRIHLGLLTLETLEASGLAVSGSVHGAFCAASDGAEMPTVDHYCGRGDLAGWISSFEYDRYEFAHQRARWESEDGKEGLATPGLDLLVAIDAVYKR